MISSYFRKTMQLIPREITQWPGWTQMILPWSAKSPDLNPIENVWGILARDVYANQRQLTCGEDLEETIMQCRDNISKGVRMHLFESMQRLCIAVNERKCGHTRQKSSHNNNICSWSFTNFARKMVLFTCFNLFRYCDIIRDYGHRFLAYSGHSSTCCLYMIRLF